MAISSLFEEFEFEFQNLQEVALIPLHLAPPGHTKICTDPKRAAVTLVTWGRDGHHRSRSPSHTKKSPRCIGTSRETVTRLFPDFKKKQLLQLKGSTPIIKNKAGLESVVS